MTLTVCCDHDLCVLIMQDTDDHIQNETVIIDNFKTSALSPLSIPTRSYTNLASEGCSRTWLDNVTAGVDEIHVLGHANMGVVHESG